jgi:hypothetical protein
MPNSKSYVPALAHAPTCLYISDRQPTKCSSGGACRRGFTPDELSRHSASDRHCRHHRKGAGSQYVVAAQPLQSFEPEIPAGS